jgi:hypothetical protein
MDKKIPKIYLDTSVFGGYYDIEFEEDTQLLFEKIKLGQFKIVYLTPQRMSYWKHLKKFGHYFLK